MNIAVIMMSGNGTRIGGDIPKQFILKDNKPLYLFTVDAFHKNRKIDSILLVTSKDNIGKVKKDVSLEKYTKIIDVIEGGEKRYNSVFNAIDFLYKKYYQDINVNVLIHDAVRCNVTNAIINRNIKALKKHNAVLTAIKGKKQSERIDTYHRYLDKDYLAQTPQSFDLKLIHGLFEFYFDSKKDDITDDISLCEMFKSKYIIVKGDKDNYKITYKEDLEKFLRK